MLAELNTSHTRRYVPMETAYYELLDIFSATLESDIVRIFPDGEVAYTGVGIFTREIDGKTYVAGVLEGGPADKAGLLTGDEIVAAGAGTFSTIASFEGRDGVPTVMTIRRQARGPTFDVMVEPRRIRPNDSFLKAMRQSISVTERDEKKLGYVHIWSNAGKQYHVAFIEQLARGPLSEVDGLVLDFRDGWGGASLDYANLYLGVTPTIWTFDRERVKKCSSVRWSKPLVVLVNEGTRSGKEIVAQAVQRQGIPLVGTRTAGAVMGATPFILNDDSVLLVAILDGTVDGERPEGRGVRPDIEVPFLLPYAAGRDPQIEAAMDLITDLI